MLNEHIATVLALLTKRSFSDFELVVESLLLGDTSSRNFFRWRRNWSVLDLLFWRGRYRNRVIPIGGSGSSSDGDRSRRSFQAEELLLHLLL